MRSGGRLVLLLGVVLAAAAALFLFLFYLPGQQAAPPDTQVTPTAVPNVKIVVARGEIPANTLFADTETFLTTEDIPEPDFNAAPGQYFTNPADLVNKVATRRLGIGERIRVSDVTDSGLSLLIPTPAPDQPSRKAITFQVNSLTGVADLVTPGDFVDLVMTFPVSRFYLRPTLVFDTESKTNNVNFTNEEFTDFSTKTLVQNVQVLKVLRVRVAADATPTPEVQEVGPPPTNADGTVVGSAQAGGAPNANTFEPGNWLVVLALTNQEAEILRYSLERASGVSMILRGRGDATVDDTLGATMSILMNEFGLPMPEPFVLGPADIQSLTPTPGR